MSLSTSCGDISLRSLKVGDAEAVAALEHSACPTCWPAEQYARRLGGEEGNAGLSAFGAFVGSGEGERLVAYVALGCAAGECEVENIAVEEGFRGQGIASALLAHALREVRKTHNMTCYLEVAVGNVPARALYARAGFRQTGLRRNYYRETGEDALVMVLDL